MLRRIVRQLVTKRPSVEPGGPEAIVTFAIGISAPTSSVENFEALKHAVPIFVGDILARYPEVTVEQWELLQTSDGEFTGEATVTIRTSNEATARTATEKLRRMWEREYRPS